MKIQTNIFEYFNQPSLKKRYSRTIHGGRPQKGHRKVERPLSRKHPIHLVLKSGRAKGPWSFLNFKNQPRIESILRKKARKFGIRIADFSNVGNHLHIKLRIHDREGFKNFLRAIASLIARTVTGARRGHKLNGAFWNGLAFTRILTSYREEIQLRGYFIANRQEAALGATARTRFLEKFNIWLREVYARPAVAELKHDP